MATGTAPVTGTVRTGMTGMRPPQSRQPIWARMLQWWNTQTQKQRTMWSMVAVGAVLAVGLLFTIHKTTAYVPLYENALSSDDISDVTSTLAKLNIPYDKTLDNHVTVSPSKKVQALTELTREGIPHHPFTESTTGSTTQTPEQFTEEQRRSLERDITTVLRQFDEVADANVKLVIPPENAIFFGDDKEHSKAAVVLKLRAGYDKLPLDKARAIVNMVAASVPKLQPENVELTDTNGRLLSEMLKKSEDEMAPNGMIEQKKALQQQLESQIRQVLDGPIGSGKYALVVNAELDWNKVKRVEQIHGSQLNVRGILPLERKVDSETYTKNGTQQQSSPGVKPLAYSNEESGGGVKGGNYVRTSTIEKNIPNSTETQTEFTPGQVKRLTASVFTDEQLSDEVKNQYRAAVEGAIGFDPERGDRVFFGMLPFHSHEIQNMATAMNNPGWLGRDSSPFSGGLLMRVVLGALIAGVVGVGLYLFREQKAQMEKTQLVLSASPATTVSDISDLLNEKTGKVTVPETSQPVAQTQKLEQLVKEKPTKVAELLKTTWLAEK